MKTALYNGGSPGAELAWSRGLHYGDGVFRTALIWEGAVVDLDRQLQLLAQDAQALDLRPPSAALLRSEVAQLAAGIERGVLKLLLWRREGGRGYAPTTADCDRLLLRSPAPSYPASHWERGVRLVHSAHVLADQPRLAGIKHLNRLDQVLASAALRDAEEAFLCDARGHPVSGTRSNLFWVVNGGLQTPALNHCGIRGMMRGKIMDLARQLGLAVDTGDAGVEALRRADEVFVCNSLIGLWPVAELDGEARPAPGPVTQRLLAALQHPRLC